MKEINHLSIFSFFLANGRAPPRGYRNVNSQRRSHLDQKSSRFVTFRYKPAESSQEVQLQIQILEAVDDTGMLDWISEFREIAELCNWNDQTSILTLRSAISQALWPLIRQKQSLTTALDALIESAYPARDRYKHQQNLLKTYQDSFATIKEYEHAIDKQLQALKYCSAFPSSQHQSRKEEALTQIP